MAEQQPRPLYPAGHIESARARNTRAGAFQIQQNRTRPAFGLPGRAPGPADLRDIFALSGVLDRPAHGAVAGRLRGPKHAGIADPSAAPPRICLQPTERRRVMSGGEAAHRTGPSAAQAGPAAPEDRPGRTPAEPRVGPL